MLASILVVGFQAAGFQARGEEPPSPSALDRARREFYQAKAQFDAFLEQHFEGHRASAASPARSLAPQPVQSRVEIRAPRTENPEWIDANEMLRVLRQRRTWLLVDRTPAHPDVEQITARIAQLEQYLAGLPRYQSVDEPAEPAGGAHKQGTPALGSEQSLAEDAGRRQLELAAINKYQEYKERLDRAAAVYERQLLAERERPEPILPSLPKSAPQVVIPEPPQAVDAPTTRLPPLWTAMLLIGLSATAAVGMIATGVRMDAPLMSCGDAARLRVPILGHVPATGLRTGTAARARSRSATRSTWIGGGLVLAALSAILGICLF